MMMSEQNGGKIELAVLGAIGIARSQAKERPAGLRGAGAILKNVTPRKTPLVGVSDALYLHPFNARVAQLAEHLICNQKVAGSIPVAGSAETEKGISHLWYPLCFFRKQPCSLAKKKRPTSSCRGRAFVFLLAVARPTITCWCLASGHPQLLSWRPSSRLQPSWQRRSLRPRLW